VPLRSDAVAWQPFAGATLDSLPSWYMPRAIATRRGRGTRFVVIGVVAVVLLINAAGLCITSGFITIA